MEVEIMFNSIETLKASKKALLAYLGEDYLLIPNAADEPTTPGLWAIDPGLKTRRTAIAEWGFGQHGADHSPTGIDGTILCSRGKNNPWKFGFSHA